MAALTEGPCPWGGSRHCPLSRMCPCGPCLWGCFLLLCLGNTLRKCQGFSALPPLPMGHLPHVEEYEVVQPLRLPISGALNEHSSRPTLYPETIRYLLGLRGNNFTLHLRRNRHLVGSDYTETYTLANGTEVTEKPQVGRHCFYQGHVEGYQNSMASISTCQGIRGFFKTGSSIYLIEPLDQQENGIPQERHGGTKGRHGGTKGGHSITQKKHDSPHERQGSTNKGYDSNQKKHDSDYERYYITQGSHDSTHERHGFTQGSQGSTHERHGVTQDSHGSAHERHGVTQGRHGSTHERHGVTQGRHGCPYERHGVTQGSHGSAHERHGVTQGRHGSAHERHGVTQGRHGCPHERHGVTQGSHGSAHEAHGITRGRHGNIHKKHDSDQEQDESNQERQGTSQSSYVSHKERLDTTQERHSSDEERHRSDQGKHAIYRQEDLKKKHRFCGVDKVTLMGELETMMAAISMPKNWRPGLVPKDTHYVELFVVMDHREYEKYKSLKKLRHRVKEIVNHVDRLYQEIKFRVVLIGLEIWDKGNKATIDSNIESTLSSFLKWRNNYLIRKKKHDNAQLITGEKFEGSVVGLARLASMCTEGSGGVSHDYSINPFGVATILAHEMGHNLGMDHDENIRGCGCENKQDRCIMTSRFASVLPKKFSSCSKYNLQKFLVGNIFSSSCLNNFPALEKLEERPVCGNKFLEQGEECDCGLPKECLNQCCNPKSCRLAPGAKCAEGACCQACQVMPAGEICREAQNACDLAEYCDGKQPKCPENVYKENGTPCWKGYCYNGACPTYKQQCQALWGKGADVSTDKCFRLKLPKGCTEAFYSSRKGLNKCKFLSCSRPSTKRSTRHLCSFLLEDESCDLAITKSENHSPFQMVAPGTKCGKKKVCYHRSCQDLSVYGARNCSSKCHDRGVCNHKQECHCNPGWAPPDCQRKFSPLKEEVLSKERSSLGHRSSLKINIKDKNLLVGLLVASTLIALLLIIIFACFKCKWEKKKESQ